MLGAARALCENAPYAVTQLCLWCNVHVCSCSPDCLHTPHGKWQTLIITAPFLGALSWTSTGQYVIHGVVKKLEFVCSHIWRNSFLIAHATSMRAIMSDAQGPQLV